MRQAFHRKNSLIVGNPRGGETAAILPSSGLRHASPAALLHAVAREPPVLPEAERVGWLPHARKVREAERQRVDGVR
jgi:hypothetical protein